MKPSLRDIRVIGLLTGPLERRLREILQRQGVHIDFAHDSAQVSAMAQNSSQYEVAIVPADPPSGEWLRLCHELTALKPRPSILVSCKRDTFSAWAQTLDAGGFGVIIEPYTYEGLQTAIQGAVDHFYGRAGGKA